MRQTHGCLYMPCSSKWWEKIILRTVDTDVVVISTTMALKFDCERLWLAFATGNTFRYIDAAAIMDMAQSRGGHKCTALPAFHALTGCDVTSSFGKRGKRTDWSAWEYFKDSTPALCILADKPSIDDVMNVLPTIERLMKIMYELWKQCQLWKKYVAHSEGQIHRKYTPKQEMA